MVIGYILSRAEGSTTYCAAGSCGLYLSYQEWDCYHPSTSFASLSVSLTIRTTHEPWRRVSWALFLSRCGRSYHELFRLLLHNLENKPSHIPGKHVFIFIFYSLWHFLSQGDVLNLSNFYLILLLPCFTYLPLGRAGAEARQTTRSTIQPYLLAALNPDLLR